MSFAANTDVLTRVSNRHGIIQRGEKLLREGKLKAVVYIDFDGLKAVNDSHGHAFGDQLLVAAVRRISEVATGEQSSVRRGRRVFGLGVSRCT